MSDQHPAQIHTASEFGQLLTKLALEAEIIVEIGTFWGEGSTRCFYQGMSRATQRLYSIDCNSTVLDHAKQVYADDPRVIFLCGTLTLPEEFAPFSHPKSSAIQHYEPEKSANNAASYVLGDIPDSIDLLLIDGGEWTADAEFYKLHARCRIIALDDTNPAISNKNCRNRLRLMGMGWTVIEDRLDMRQGIAVFGRP